jgi:hypothetical protein
MMDSDENSGDVSIVGVAFDLSDVEEQVASLNVKVEVLRNENAWLREELVRIQDVAFERAAEIAYLRSHAEDEE